MLIYKINDNNISDQKLFNPIILYNFPSHSVTGIVLTSPETATTSISTLAFKGNAPT